jgi:beta-mannosidase
VPAKVPGTAAGALRDAGLWSPGEDCDFDARDWWFRAGFSSQAIDRDAPAQLCFGGIATLAEVYLNGEMLFESDSMFLAHAVELTGRLESENVLWICCRALAPTLRERRRPRARWRSRIADGGLRFHRTMLLGRAPGFAAGPATVGPWRPVFLAQTPRSGVSGVRLRARLEGARGVLHVRARVASDIAEASRGGEVELVGGSHSHKAPLELSELIGPQATELSAELTVAEPDLWWPHTHGEPALYSVRLRLEGRGGPNVLDAGRVGFRTLAAGPVESHDLELGGLDLHVNGIRTFARGALWTPLDIVTMAPSRERLRAALEQVQACGMNMLRLPGTGCYEVEHFYELCDELGILVWQDFMFANFDYPIADGRFRASVEQEALQVLELVSHRPSLAVLCGNSEVEQQVAMLGLDPALGRGELFGELLPRLVEDAELDAVYVPSAPCGGTLPFRSDTGIANYYGVGGYRRPLEDVRSADVKFAAECLAFANVPDAAVLERLAPAAAAAPPVHDPRWKRGVPRDVGAGWDFDDVRDHYLARLYGVDPGELRRVDNQRYLELSRTVTGEAMAEVMGEWRSERSSCGGGLILWLTDLVPGAGWGLIDSTGAPKSAYHHLRRALAPVCVWITDEGLAGLRVHVANDGPEQLRGCLRLATYRDLGTKVAEAEEAIELAPHGLLERDLEALLGSFVDISWAYRFGPCEHEAVLVSLESESGELLSQAVRFPAGRPLLQRPAAELGIEASIGRDSDGSDCLLLQSRLLAYGVRVHVRGLVPEDDAFTLEPAVPRLVRLRRLDPDAAPPADAKLTALNLRGHVSVARATEEA